MVEGGPADTMIDRLGFLGLRAFRVHPRQLPERPSTVPWTMRTQLGAEDDGEPSQGSVVVEETGLVVIIRPDSHVRYCV